MARTESWFEQDLQKPVVQRYIKGNFFSLDNVGNLVGVKVYDNGAEASLSGSVTGYCVLADGTTVNVTGYRSNTPANQAYILLPQSALSIPGYIGITLKLVDGSTITTLLSIIATVYPSQTDDVITPSQQVITDWAQQINTALQNVVDASAAQDAKISDLKSALNIAFPSVESTRTFEQGGLKSSNGGKSSSTTRIRTYSYLCPGMGVKITIPSGAKAMWFKYGSEVVDSYIGYSEDWITGTIDLSGDAYYKIVVAYTDDGAITPDAGANVIFAFNGTDKDLTVDGAAADAKAVGDILNTAATYNGLLADGTDLDTVTNAGMYNMQGGNSFVHCPELTRVANLIVLGSPSNRMQIICEATGDLYYRHLSTTITDWYHISGHWGAFPNIALLTSADDLNSLAINGAYFYSSSSIPANAPDSTGGIVLNIIYNATYAVQMKADSNNSMYVRTRVSAGFTKWKNLENGKDELIFSAVKGAWTKAGTIAHSVLGLCADHIFQLTPKSQLDFYLDPCWVYTIREGESATNLQERTAHLSNARTHIVKYPFVSISFSKFVDGEGVDLTVDDFDNSVVVRTSGGAVVETVEDDGAYHDFPESYGQLNVVSRAYQMCKAVYTTEAVLPMHSGGSKTVTVRDVDAGTEVTGIPYSSMRETMMSVPQAVSFHSFMTAIQNPNSYLYTRHYEQGAPGYDYNSRCYFGAVCSTMVAYAYGITDVMPTTISFADYPGLDPLPEVQQNPYYLKLADMLNHAGDHIVVVTDIIRNYRGRIEQIEVSEAWKPLCRSVRYTPEEIQSRYFDEGFVAYRYANIDSVAYAPDPWVHIDSTETDDPVYTRELCPRKGDKTNWSVGEVVEIDILDSTGYTGYAVINLTTGATVVTASIPANMLISLSGLAAGKYAVRLTGTINSGYVYFDVIDMTVSYTPLGNHKVRVNYASSQGTPSAIYWCCNVQSDSDYKAVRAFHLLTAEEKEAGYAVIDEPVDQRDEDKVDGLWLMRMGFMTEFGHYASDLTEVQVS